MSSIGPNLPSLLGDGQLTQVQLAVAVKAQKLARSQQEQVLQLLEGAIQDAPAPRTAPATSQPGLDVTA